MAKILEQIWERIKYLPDKDRAVAQRHLEHRDFTLLYELIESVLKLINKNEESTHPNMNYVGLDEFKIVELFSLVSEYCRVLNPEDFEEE